MQVSIRELKANPAHAIERMRRGEVVQITSHRKVVAELVAPKISTQADQALSKEISEEEGMQRVIDSGAFAQLPTKPLRLGKSVTFPPGPNGQTMSELVLEMRGPR